MISYFKEKIRAIIIFCKITFPTRTYYDIEKAEYVRDHNKDSTLS